MKIAIRKEPNGSVYMDKDIFSRTHEVQDENGNIELVPMFTDEELSQPPYNYKIVEIDDKYADCIYSDFDYTDDTFVFNLAKYNARKTNAENLKKIAELKLELVPIKEDVEQVELFGMVRDDYEEKKQRCAEIVNEIRTLMGKEPRKIKNISNRMS